MILRGQTRQRARLTCIFYFLSLYSSCKWKSGIEQNVCFKKYPSRRTERPSDHTPHR
jgi:hypothetical protein